MLKDGKPDLENEAVVGTLEYIKSLNDAGVISPGIFAKKEQDKVEEFVNGRVGDDGRLARPHQPDPRAQSRT